MKNIEFTTNFPKRGEPFPRKRKIPLPTTDSHEEIIRETIKYLIGSDYGKRL
jgi:hypothetical protein